MTSLLSSPLLLSALLGAGLASASAAACGVNTWNPTWASSADAACARWVAESWGAPKYGTLKEACQTTSFGQSSCAGTCCEYYTPPAPPPPSHPPAVPTGHPQTPPPPPRPPPPPDLIHVLEGDLSAAEREVLDELGMSSHHAFHFGVGLACFLVLILVTATCAYFKCIRKRRISQAPATDVEATKTTTLSSTPKRQEIRTSLPQRPSFPQPSAQRIQYLKTRMSYSKVNGDGVVDVPKADSDGVVDVPAVQTTPTTPTSSPRESLIPAPPKMRSPSTLRQQVLRQQVADEQVIRSVDPTVQLL